MIASQVVSWKQYARAAEVASRRHRREADREAIRQHRELLKSERESAKIAEKQQAANEAARFENYLEILVSVHKDCGDTWDWKALASCAAPPAPVRSDRREAAAANAMQTYTPGFFDRVFGGAKKRRAVLERELSEARAADLAEYERTAREQQAATATWNFRRTIAPKILAADSSVFVQALGHAGAFDDVSSFKTRVTVTALESDVVTLSCEITDREIVPREEVKLTSSGKLTTKAMATGRYWSLYQDHVCSCALRVANETFAVLPVSRVIVNVGSIQVNPSTGHHEMVTMVAVHVSRGVLLKLNLNNVDPSDALKNFPHRMRFKKATGFDPVPAMTTDEQWVTT